MSTGSNGRPRFLFAALLKFVHGCCARPSPSAAVACTNVAPHRESAWFAYHTSRAGPLLRSVGL
jgi:hypothetical protein